MLQKKMNCLFIVPVLFFLSLEVQGKTPEEDHQKNKEFRQKCERIREHNISSEIVVECFHNYHHYNASAYENHYNFFRARHYGEVRIGSFNLWHPGSSKSGLKDYDLIAKVIDQWDILSAQELLPVVGEDLRHNESVKSFIEQGPELVAEISKQLAGTKDPELKEKLLKELSTLKSDLKRAPNLYRAPGYLKLLKALRKIDPSWALILSPRGEAAESFHVQELTGFFYRASRVKPIVNKHCKEFPERTRNGRPYACFPNFYKDFMDKDVAQAFSRRPFMASFRSAGFDFSLLSTHVIFSSPRDEEKMGTIMRAAFDLDTYIDLGPGFNLATYARFAEIKLTLDFMQRYADRYKNPNLIYTGDMNIEANNYYWPEILKSFDGAEVFIDEQTSMSQIRYRSNGEPTFGLASNYDHFIFSPKLSPQCDGDSAKTFNFYTSWVSDFLEDEYMIRNERAPLSRNKLSYKDDDGVVYDGNEPDLDNNTRSLDFSALDDYDLRPGAKQKMRRKVEAYREYLKSRLTIRDNKIVWDDSLFERRMDIYKSRIFFDQLEDRTYYRVFFELLSDHVPISMNCRNI